MTLADVVQVHTGAPTLVIVYAIAILVFGGAAAFLLWMMRQAAQAYDERPVLKLAVGTSVSALLTAAALILFVDAIGFIGQVLAGLAIVITVVLVLRGHR